MIFRYLPILVPLFMVACQSPSGDGAESGAVLATNPPPPTARLTATAETTPTVTDGANDAAILVDPMETSNSVVLGADATGGLEVYGLDGARVGLMDDHPVTLVDVRYGFPLAGESIPIVATYDPVTTEIVAYRLRGTTPERISAAAAETRLEAEGLCLYRSPDTGRFYVFATGEGIIQQWELYDAGGNVAASHIRDIPVGLGAGHCVAHDRDSLVYFAQETVGVWRLPAEPEAEALAEPLALAAPHGPFVGDVKGVAVIESEDGPLLIGSDADESRFHVFELGRKTLVGTFSVDGVDETEGVSATSASLSGNLGAGLLVLADDANEGAHTNYKLVAWSEVAAGLALAPLADGDPTIVPAPRAITVTADVETDPVDSYGDAADDPAIWLHPEDPAKSIVIGSQKQRGVHVYDLDGNLLQTLNEGRINNVDIRYGFLLGGEQVDIVAGSNRTTDSLSFWRVLAESRTLENVTDDVVATGMSDPYGLCLYHSQASGDYYVFVNDTDGKVEQYRVEDRGNGRIGAILLREFAVGSQTEGCVADDETGDLYIGEEGVAIWKYRAEPDAGNERIMVDSIEDGNLDGDIEGLAIYYGQGGAGYLLASNQGTNNFAVYERSGDNAFLGFFAVVGDGATGIDGISETDGLDVTSAGLGAGFPAGVFVAQDGRNITPAERQNFKLVRWDRIAAAMGLTIYSGYDPRRAIGAE